MGQGTRTKRDRNLRLSKRGRKSLLKKPKTAKKKRKLARNAKFALTRSKKTFAKLGKIRKKQQSNAKLTRNINNKNHDLAVQAALRNGEPLGMVGQSKDTHTRKIRVKR